MKRSESGRERRGGREREMERKKDSTDCKKAERVTELKTAGQSWKAERESGPSRHLSLNHEEEDEIGRKGK